MDRTSGNKLGSVPEAGQGQAGRSPAPLTLRLSVTDRCDLRCLYCLPPEGASMGRHEDVLRYEEVADFVRIVRARLGVSKVRITGGEPLIRRGIVDFVAALGAMGLPDLALTTNGVRLADLAADLRRTGVRRVNVSLDTLDPQVYRELTRGGRLADALAGIDAALGAGLRPVKLNMVVLRGINQDEVVRMARYGLERGCPVRFLEVMPIGAAAGRHRDWLVPSGEVRARLAEELALEPLPREPGASSRDFLARDADGRTGRIGFISPCTAPFCGDCRRLRLTATGRLLGCLARPEGIDVRPLLRARGPTYEAALADAVEEALGLKRAGRRFADQQLMAGIGG